MWRLKILLCAIVILTVNAHAGTTGKIAGTVLFSETGEPAAGTNVYFEGTTLGASADMDGNYFILNIPPGKYTLIASMVGFKDVRVTDVKVDINRTKVVDILLETEAIMGEEITVVADRERVKLDVSSSQVSIDAEEAIENAPVTDFTDFLNLQPGIEDLLIRGGSQDQTIFMVDGVVMVDERRNQPILNVNLSAIQEVELLTGGFNAEYGNVRSGVINVVTKRGTDEYSGSVDIRISPPAYKHFGDEKYWTADWQRWAGPESMQPSEDFIGWIAYAEQLNNDADPSNDITAEGARKKWEWQHRRIEYGSKGPADYIGEASFSGPLPFVKDTKFFVSYRDQFNSSIVPLYARQDKEILGQDSKSFQSRFIHSFSPSLELNIGATYIDENWLRDFWGMTRSWLSLGHLPANFGKYSYQYVPADKYTNILSAKISHTLSPKTFYTVQIERTNVIDRASPGAYRDTTDIFEYEPGKFLDEGPLGPADQGHRSDMVGVYEWNGGPFLTDKSSISTYRLRGDINSQINNFNLIKTGFEIAYNDLRENMQYVDSSHTQQDTRFRWNRFPIRASAYIQDKIEWEGMIANLGLRADYADANVEWFSGDPYNKYYSAQFRDSLSLIPKEENEPRLTLSPRFGISHPISEATKLFFNYGHFYSMPTNTEYYGFQQGKEFDKRITLLGNPDLNVPKTVAYEIGFEQDLFETAVITLTGYYKNVTDQPGQVRYISRFGTVDYVKYKNKNYQDIRGFELRLEKRYGRFFYGWLNYNYMEITDGYIGWNTFYEDPRIKPAKEGAEQFKPVAQPSLRTSVQFHTPLDYGPEILGFKLLGGWVFNGLYTWRAGAHFTYLPQGPDETNNVQWVNYSNVDLRIRKQFDGPLGTKPEFYITINNLFNQKYLNPGAFNSTEWVEYMQSLKLPLYEGDRKGNDRVGIFPDGGKNEYVNIDVNPLNRWKLFLWPRDIYIGFRIFF